jgi:hypothetical protein
MGAVSIRTAQAAQSAQAKSKTPTRAELKVFKARAEQGDADAACQLGTIYRNGQVVRTDYAEAYKWYTIGFWLSHDFENTCADDRGRLRKLVPAEEVAGGFKRALPAPPHARQGRGQHRLRTDKRQEHQPHVHPHTCQPIRSGGAPALSAVGSDDPATTIAWRPTP